LGSTALESLRTASLQLKGDKNGSAIGSLRLASSDRRAGV